MLGIGQTQILVSVTDEIGAGAVVQKQKQKASPMTLLLAGHETTANTLTWTWFELGKHPEVRDRLEAEVQRVAGARPITTDDLPALPTDHHSGHPAGEPQPGVHRHRAIVGIEIALSSLTGKWKLSQNRPAADRAGVVAGLRREDGDEALAREVQSPGAAS